MSTSRILAIVFIGICLLLILYFVFKSVKNGNKFKEKKQKPKTKDEEDFGMKINYNEDSLSPKKQESYEEFLQEKAQKKSDEVIDSYESYVANQNQDNNLNDLFADQNQVDEFPHFKIEEYDYNKDLEENKIEEIGFDESYDVNEGPIFKEPEISKVFNKLTKEELIILTSDALKKKYFD